MAQNSKVKYPPKSSDRKTSGINNTTDWKGCFAHQGDLMSRIFKESHSFRETMIHSTHQGKGQKNFNIAKK